ncbi:hypothetical protein GQ457_07G004070 [Hibiscus cannabinus]
MSKAIPAFLKKRHHEIAADAASVPAADLLFFASRRPSPPPVSPLPLFIFCSACFSKYTSLYLSSLPSYNPCTILVDFLIYVFNFSLYRFPLFKFRNGQPIGAEASVLANYLGVVARNGSILPINHISWHEMPGGNKNQALNLVKTKFSLEVSDKYLKQTLGKKWRDHKSNLKKKFFKNDLTLESKKQNPPGILRYQWEDACDFWNSNKGESRERIGVVSREKQKFTHTAGSKSFARIANEHEITSGSSVGRIQLFDITHTRKDGSPITSEAAEIMEKLREKRAEYEATASTHNSSVNANDIDNQVIAEVFGPERYGRNRGQGSFVTPIAYFGSSSS